MEEDYCLRELQLLPNCSSPRWAATCLGKPNPSSHQSLDLNLAIGSPNEDVKGRNMSSSIQTLRGRTAEQIQLAAVEKVYAEKVRELTRREMELAEQEFAQARLVWERAREEVEKAEMMKMMATKKVGSMYTEITCRSCRQRFRL